MFGRHGEDFAISAIEPDGDVASNLDVLFLVGTDGDKVAMVNQDIRGLQMNGNVIRLEHGQEWDAAWQVYQGKFPFVAGMKDIVARNNLYIFHPAWVRLVDNRQGFGFKQEWRLE